MRRYATRIRTRRKVKSMMRFWRWLTIRLLVACAGRKVVEHSRDDRKIYKLVGSLRLVGQAPASAYTLGGNRTLVLLGEGVQYRENKITLRLPGAFFVSEGIMQVVHPGSSWLWMVQMGDPNG